MTTPPKPRRSAVPKAPAPHTPPGAAPERATHPPPAAHSLLPRYLALAYVVLIVYASLHPFAGWRDLGLSPFVFLDAGWPRYWTLFDFTTNILAYLPLGFLLTLTLRRLPGRATPAIAALLLGTLISLCLESAQSWLPARVPSNLDLGCNTLGTGLGALLAILYGERFFERASALQRTLLAPLPHAELGLVVLGLWLLTQLSPETLLFGAGDLRHLIGLAPAVPYAAKSFFVIETVVIVCNMVAIGLIARTLLAGRYAPQLVLLVFFALALTIRTLAAAILVMPQNALSWLTPGAELGLLIGGVVLTLTLLLPPAPRLAVAGMALMAGTVLVNLAPPNPYSLAALALWRQGHFLNFNGLTRLTASLWPFLALPYLTVLGRRL